MRSTVRSGSQLAVTALVALALVSGLSSGAIPAAAQDGDAADLCWPNESPDDSGGYPQWESPPVMVIDEGEDYAATIVTEAGDIELELFADEAPIAVNNFVCLALAGYYDDTAFHRVVPGFVIQGGDPSGDSTGGPGYEFEDEPVERDYEEGTLAMANAGPDTNGSQFFIVLDDEAGAELPPDYTIFGEVTDGLDVVQEIGSEEVEPGSGDGVDVETIEIDGPVAAQEQTNGDEPTEGATVVTTADTDLRSAPSDDGVLVDELVEGTELEVIGEPAEGDGTTWTLVQDPETENVGYVDADDIEVDE